MHEKRFLKSLTLQRVPGTDTAAAGIFLPPLGRQQTGATPGNLGRTVNTVMQRGNFSANLCRIHGGMPRALANRESAGAT
jgi:hypothetical protein